MRVSPRCTFPTGALFCANFCANFESFEKLKKGGPWKLLRVFGRVVSGVFRLVVIALFSFSLKRCCKVWEEGISRTVRWIVHDALCHDGDRPSQTVVSRPGDLCTSHGRGWRPHVDRADEAGGKCLATVACTLHTTLETCSGTSGFVDIPGTRSFLHEQVQVGGVFRN